MVKRQLSSLKSCIVFLMKATAIRSLQIKIGLIIL